VPFYLFMLVASLGLAGIVVYQFLRSPRRARRPAVQATARVANVVEAPIEREMTDDERTIQARKRRERRQKSAEARRRRAGKA
jgi:hypothetical protein